MRKKIVLLLVLLLTCSAFGSTVLTRTSLKNPFEFPYAGTMRNYEQECRDIISSTPITIFSSPTGTSGVIRNISLIIAGNNDNYFVLPKLNIKYDGESSPTVSIPILKLIMATEPNTAILPINLKALVQNDFITTTDPLGLTSLHLSCQLRYPIPYSNGVIITASTSSQTFTVWSNVMYQTSLPSCWNRNLRFKVYDANDKLAACVQQTGTITKADGSTTITGVGTTFTGLNGKYIQNNDGVDYYVVSVTDANHAVSSLSDANSVSFSGDFYLEDTFDWLTIAAGKKGYIAAVVGSFQNYDSNDFSFFESNPRIFLNGETNPSISFSGTEDMFNRTWYFTVKTTDNESGVVGFYNNASAAATVYRLFNKCPIRFTNGAKGQVSNSSYSDTVFYTWTVVYYDEQ